jgi:hypothetical protein
VEVAPCGVVLEALELPEPELPELVPAFGAGVLAGGIAVVGGGVAVVGQGIAVPVGFAGPVGGWDVAAPGALGCELLGGVEGDGVVGVGAADGVLAVPEVGRPAPEGAAVPVCAHPKFTPKSNTATINKFVFIKFPLIPEIRRNLETRHPG